MSGDLLDLLPDLDDPAPVETEADGGGVQAVSTFNDATDDSLPSVEIMAGWHVPDEFSQFGSRVGIDSETSQFTFVALLTVPNEAVFPSPVASADVAVIDPKVLSGKSSREIIAAIGPTMSDSVLESLRVLELARKQVKNGQARKLVMNAIEAEQISRGPAFSEWLQRCERDAYRQQIAAVAWAVGSEEPMALVVGRNGSEGEVIKKLAAAVAAGGGFWRGEAAWNVSGVRLLVQLRAVALDLQLPLQSSRPVSSHLSDLGCDLESAVAVLGLSDGFKRPLMTAAQVLEGFREFRFRELETEVLQRLEMSRAVILAERLLR